MSFDPCNGDFQVDDVARDGSHFAAECCDLVVYLAEPSIDGLESPLESGFETVDDDIDSTEDRCDSADDGDDHADYFGSQVHTSILGAWAVMRKVGGYAVGTEITLASRRDHQGLLKAC
ncbi:MAG: hypothetical protein ACNYNX_05225 [Leucobacter sp.]